MKPAAYLLSLRAATAPPSRPSLAGVSRCGRRNPWKAFRKAPLPIIGNLDEAAALLFLCLRYLGYDALAFKPLLVGS